MSGSWASEVSKGEVEREGALLGGGLKDRVPLCTWALGVVAFPIWHVTLVVDEEWVRGGSPLEE
jgi:hypothetical protein